jgi:hypothetical protein
MILNCGRLRSGGAGMNLPDDDAIDHRLEEGMAEGNGQRSGIVGRVKESATAQLTNQKDRGLNALDSVAQAVRSTTGKLRDEQHDIIANSLEQAAAQIERWSQRLKDKDIGELMTDMQRLARRQPGVFIGSAFALGVVGARFLKSSRQDDGYGNAGVARARSSGDVARTYSDVTTGTAEASIPYGVSAASDTGTTAQHTQNTASRTTRARRPGGATERS